MIKLKEKISRMRKDVFFVWLIMGILFTILIICAIIIAIREGNPTILISIIALTAIIVVYNLLIDRIRGGFIVDYNGKRKNLGKIKNETKEGEFYCFHLRKYFFLKRKLYSKRSFSEFFKYHICWGYFFHIIEKNGKMYILNIGDDKIEQKNN